ncbi:MAG: SDR family oxidoreductase [Bacteroidota bacterium]
MILIAGGTGLLGGTIAREFLSGKSPVRILTRNPQNARKLQDLGAEIVKGDMRDSSTLHAALEGIKTVISTANSFKGKGKTTIKTDSDGYKNLIDAAKEAGVEHFIYISANVPKEFNKIDFFRYKTETEEYLKQSGIKYTIIRPTFFMDVWAQLIGVPLIKRGSTTIFGRGENPINFISVEDVAKITIMSLNNKQNGNHVFSVGGPENLTLRQVADTFEQVTKKKGVRKFAFLPALRVMAFIMRLYSPLISRQMRTAILMDTADLRFNSTETQRSFPVKLLTLKDWIKKKYA